MSEELEKGGQPRDYSQLIQAVSRARQTTRPDWLKPGEVVNSPNYGRGVIQILIGGFVKVQFDNRSEAVEFTDWQTALSRGELEPPTTEERERAFDQIEHPAYQKLAEEWGSQIRYVHVAPPRAGELVEIPAELSEPLKRSLRAKGITKLFSHQLTAYQIVSQRNDLALSTGVNSGKTIAFSLPVLDGALKHNHTSLVIVPTNQLMSDQFEKMCGLMELSGDDSLVCGKINGSVEAKERLAMLRDEPDVIFINPDCLNTLVSRIRDQQYRKLNEFLNRLKYVVIDEAHEACGVLGAHLAGILMRLRLAVDRVGGKPWELQYIVCSATVRNQRELADTLTQRHHPYPRPPIQIIDDQQNGAPNPGRVSLVFSPQAGTASSLTRLSERLLDTDLTTILFFNSRNGSKKLLDSLSRALRRSRKPDQIEQVKLFNSSVSIGLKQKAIEGIRDGSVKLVLSTSSLEAGVDLPELDCSIVWGFPKLSSLRQRWGRAGRGAVPGLCLFLPGASNLDYYYSRHPEKLIEGEVEAALLDPHYPVRLGQHLLAAAAESGLRLEEIQPFFGETAEIIGGELLNQGSLALSRNQEFLYATGRPWLDIPVRGNKQHSVKLVNSRTGQLLESLSYHYTIREAFCGAIYRLQDEKGKLTQFRSRGLQPGNSTSAASVVLLDPIDTVGRFTQAVEESEITVKRQIEQKQLNFGRFGTLNLRLDWSLVESKVTGYQEWESAQILSCESSGCKKRGAAVSYSRTNRCEGCNQPLKLKQVKQDLLGQVDFEESAIEIYRVECPSLTLWASPELKKSLETWVRERKRAVRAEHKDKVPLPDQALFDSNPVTLGLHTFLHTLVVALPLGDLYSTQDINDLIRTEQLDVNDVECVLIDTADGGTGATEYLFGQIKTVAQNALRLSQECECENVGCPRCTSHSSCLEDNESLYKRLGVELLQVYLNSEQKDDEEDSLTTGEGEIEASSLLDSTQPQAGQKEPDSANTLDNLEPAAVATVPLE